MTYSQTVHLLSAAVMPHQGCYNLKQITAAAFKDELIKAATDENTNFQHYVGHKNTLALLKRWTGVELGETNVAQIKMQDRDDFLILRLWRVLDKDEKMRTMRADSEVVVEDFHFFRGTYYKNMPIL